MKNNMDTQIGAIVLAAGKGSRMKSKDANKVTLSLNDKPMILHTVELLEKVNVHPLVIVVGFAKESVMNILGERVYFAVQEKRLGTAHAALKGLEKMPEEVENVLILNGDDSAFYTERVIKDLVKKHVESDASFTFLTLSVANPQGLGRVVRNLDGDVVKIVEEKDATSLEREITEINPACYLFKTSFLKKFLKQVKKSPITGEYYLVSLVELAVQNKEKLTTLHIENIPWRGVNTKEELEEARDMFVTIDK